MLLLIPVVAILLGGAIGALQYDRLAAALGGDAPSDDEEQASGEVPVEYGLFSQLQGIIVNPAESGGRRYLMVDVGFESHEEKTLAELVEKEIVIRDAIVRLLSEQTVDQLASVGHRTALKDSVRVRVNAILDGDVDRLYFTQYVLQ